MQVISDMETCLKDLAAKGFVQHRPKQANEHDVLSAICYAGKLPVSSIQQPIRIFLELFNDAPWSSPEARGAGLCRLAITCAEYQDIDATALSVNLRKVLKEKNLSVALRFASEISQLSDLRQILDDCADACARLNSIERIDELVAQVETTIGCLHENIINKQLGNALCLNNRRCVEAVRQASKRLAGGSSNLNLAMRHLWFAAWFCIEAQSVTDRSIIDRLLSELADTVTDLIIETKRL